MVLSRDTMPTPSSRLATSRIACDRAPRTGRAAQPRLSGEPWPVDVQRLLDQARATDELLARGRHADGERSLRAISAALERRGALEAASEVWHRLARLLSERGRWQDAHAAFGTAAQRAGGAGHEPLRSECEAWAAWCLVCAGALDVAAVALRAGVRREGPVWRAVEATWWVAARDAGRPCGETAWTECRTDGAMAATEWGDVQGRALVARALVATGLVFEAGREVRAAWDALPDAVTARLRLPLEVAQLAVLATTGDAALFDPVWREVTARARRLHLPLAWREANRIGAEVARRGRSPGWRSPGWGVDAGRAVVQASYREADDVAAVRAVAAEAARVLGGVTVAVWRCRTPDGASLEPVTATGGTCAGEDRPRERVWIREGEQCLGLMECRWDTGPGMPASVRSWLDLVGAVLAPRLLALGTPAPVAPSCVPEFVGISEAVQALRVAVARAAVVPFSVLIEGESGAGKELVARALHRLSTRAGRPFRDLNCAALPDELVEAELFGHARGAYTGALAERSGLFEEASGGTLFLDEVPDLSLRAQAKLLRVLQQREVRRLGEAVTRPVDVRLVAATNRPLGRMADEGTFRSDLLYRLDVVRVRVPPLRERPEDVPVLADHFWQDAARQVGTRARLTPALLGRLAAYHWPGNVRQLQNVVSALAVAAPVSGTVGDSLLPPELRHVARLDPGGTEPSLTLSEARCRFERRLIVRTLAHEGGSRTRAAARLGLSRQGLLKLMARLGVQGGGPAREPDEPSGSR